MPWQAALGIERRNEKYESFDTGVGYGQDKQRYVSSVFAEIDAPIVSDEGGARSVLDLRLAGRYDDFSDFGGTFNPQAGLIWTPTNRLRFRGSYARTFRAPPLFTLSAEQDAALVELVDPTSPSGASTVLFTVGGNPSLQPEKADSWTISLDYSPMDRARITLSYFDIDYTNRIDEPGARDEILLSPAVFASIINRNPTEAQAQAIVRSAFFFDNLTGVPFDFNSQNFHDSFPGIVLIDDRRQNIATEALNGLDLDVQLRMQASFGDLSFSLGGTYYLSYERRVTPAAEPIDQIDRPGKPVRARLRASMGVSRGAFDAFIFGNYVDAYTDNFAPVPTPVSSWTTADFTLRFSGDRVGPDHMLHSMTLSLSAENVFDRAPPKLLSNQLGLGFDAVNANGLGRYVSARVEKRW
jgi:iron complex outermembrane receptor protein